VILICNFTIIGVIGQPKSLILFVQAGWVSCFAWYDTIMIIGMKLSPLFVIIILLNAFLSAGESLWDPDFNGYISPRMQIAPGDVLVVLIDTSLSLSHVSTQKDSKTITFEYSGGEYGDLFSFLPDVTTGIDNTIRGDESYSFTSEMVVRVVSLENNELGYIEGSREIAIDSKRESITLTGYINVKDIDQHRQVPFSKIVDSRLIFQTFLYPRDYILTEEDIVEIMEEITGETGEVTMAAEEPLSEDTAAVEEPGPGETEVTGEPATTGEETREVIRQTRLSKEKKMELFLRYVNRMIDLLFQ
jgi:hypothetical protein